jgi:hypothetical protein
MLRTRTMPLARVGYAAPWLALAALSAAWITADPEGILDTVHPLFAVPLVVAPLVVGLGLLVVADSWRSYVARLAVFGVAPLWGWSVTSLPIDAPALMGMPRWHIWTGLLWIACVAIAISAMVADTTPSLSHVRAWARLNGYLGSAISIGAVWVVLVGLAMMRGALTP